MGVIEIFGGMGKNFRVCRYAFYLFESFEQKVCQNTLLYTSLANTFYSITIFRNYA